MTKFLKTSALIAFLLSSFSITALAANDTKLPGDLFSRIHDAKGSSDPKIIAAGKKAEAIICSKHPKNCDQNHNLINQNVGNDLNNDPTPEARATCGALFNIDNLNFNFL